MRVGTQGLFRQYLKTFVTSFLPARLTAPGSPRMRPFWIFMKVTADYSFSDFRSPFPVPRSPLPAPRSPLPIRRFMLVTSVFNCLFPLDVRNEIQLLSEVFCYSRRVGFWLRNTSLVKVGNPISDGIVFVFHLT